MISERRLVIRIRLHKPKYTQSIFEFHFSSIQNCLDSYNEIFNVFFCFVELTSTYGFQSVFQILTILAFGFVFVNCEFDGDDGPDEFEWPAFDTAFD